MATQPPIEIINTTPDDLPMVLHLFEQAMEWQGKNGYKVWHEIDNAALEKDIANNLQYKILQGNDVLCIFSVALNDPFTWSHRDRNDAIYLHRIVTNPLFKGQQQFEKVLHWSMQFARQLNRPCIRMDTWADNTKIISYYQSFGFVFIGNHRTPDTPELPLQNRNLNVSLLELLLP